MAPEHVELTLTGLGLGLGTSKAAKTAPWGDGGRPGSPAMVIWINDFDKAFGHPRVLINRPAAIPATSASRFHSPGESRLKS